MLIGLTVFSPLIAASIYIQLKETNWFGTYKDMENLAYRVWSFMWWGCCGIAILFCFIIDNWTTWATIFLCVGSTVLYVTILFIYWLIRKYLIKTFPYKEMRDFIVRTLKEVGCTPEIDKKLESDVEFMYQGEHMTIRVENDTLVTIYDTWWATFSIDNPQIEVLKEAINATNTGNMVTIVHTEDKENKQLVLHTRYRMFLRKDFPAVSGLLVAVLQNFFAVKDELKGRFAALNDEKEEAAQKKERIKIKGFSSENE